MPWSEVDEIEYNTIGTFQTSDSNTPVYYIVWCTGNAYTLEEQYTCHAFDPTVIINEVELVCPAKFMTSMRKFLFLSRSIWSNPCHGKVKVSFDSLHWIDSGQQYNK